MEIKLNGIAYKNIKNLNLLIKEKYITSIIGTNRSGKTNILNLIYGINKLEDGEIKIDNNIIDIYTKKSELTEIRKDISYLIEDYNSLLFSVNILEDIKYSIDNIDNKKLEELLNLFNLKNDILYKNYAELSNGEKKKILLIKIILEDKKIILLDNPNTGLDYKSKETLIKLLKREKRNGKTIIITSLDENFLLRVSDTVAIIYNGKVLIYDDKYKILEKEKVLEKVNMKVPNILRIQKRIKDTKNIEFRYKNNINDLLKDVCKNEK